MVIIIISYYYYFRGIERGGLWNEQVLIDILRISAEMWRI